MPGRRVARPEWTRPSDAELLVLREHLAELIAEGERIRYSDYAENQLAGWEAGLIDVVRRAIGYEWADRIDGAISGMAFQMLYEEDTAYAREVRLGERNEMLGRYLDIASGALKAIDRELTLRGTAPGSGAPNLAAEDFPFVADRQLRRIAVRDYGELRMTSVSAVKSRLVLAGSVIEAILMDALVRAGAYDLQNVARLQFADFIREAHTARLIGDRARDTAKSVKDYRNLVHPAVEVRGDPIRPVDAEAAIALMKMLLEDVR